MKQSICSTCLVLAVACSPMAALGVAYAQLLPDKVVASVGDWTISTAVYGVGCVATLPYDEDSELSISGEAKSELVLLVTADPNRFDTAIDGSSEDASHIEVALAGKRWGGVEPYGFRGTPGIVLRIESDFLSHLEVSKRLKVTELGKEKVSILLGDSASALKALIRCFDDQ